VTEKTKANSLLDEALLGSALDEALRALQELGPEGGLERFAASLDPEWIVEALAFSDGNGVYPAAQATGGPCDLDGYRDVSFRRSRDSGRCRQLGTRITGRKEPCSE